MTTYSLRVGTKSSKVILLRPYQRQVPPVPSHIPDPHCDHVDASQSASSVVGQLLVGNAAEPPSA